MFIIRFLLMFVFCFNGLLTLKAQTEEIILDPVSNICFNSSDISTSIKFERMHLLKTRGFVELELELNKDFEIINHNLVSLKFYYYDGEKCFKRIKDSDSINSYGLDNKISVFLNRIKFYRCSDSSKPKDNQKLNLNIPIEN